MDFALLAKSGDAEALAFLTAYFDFYADHYHDFPVHGDHVGKGRVMPQVLDEAVFAMRLIRAYAVCRDLWPEDKKKDWYDKLFRPLSAFITPQEKDFQNIALWVWCTYGAIAAAFDDEEALRDALEIRRQCENGFTADGFWREGSVSYHYYSLDALTCFLSLYRETVQDDPLFETLERAYIFPLTLSYDGSRLLSGNDGWYPLSVSKYASQLLHACRIVDSETLNDLLRQILKKSPAAVPYSETVLFLPRKIIINLLADSRLAVIHLPLFAVLKSGVLMRNHMHADALSVVIPPYADDLGTPGYGHPSTNAWYRQAVSHNTFCLDGAQPMMPLKNHLEETPDGVKAVLDETFSDLRRAERTLTVLPYGLRDDLVLSSETAHDFDWLFHSSGEMSVNGKTMPCSAAFGDKYDGYFEEWQRVKSEEEDLVVSFERPEGTLTLTVKNQRRYAVFTALSPGNPLNEKRCSLILRIHDSQAAFTVLYTEKRSSDHESV